MNNPKYLIIHHSLTKDGPTVSWEAIRKYHMETNGWSDIGYHYGVELVGSSYQVMKGRDESVVGAHCKEEGMNRNSLGICMVGNYDLAPVQSEGLLLLTTLVKRLMLKYNIPVLNVKRHGDYAPKSCPGSKFQWDGFLAGLR